MHARYCVVLLCIAKVIVRVAFLQCFLCCYSKLNVKKRFLGSFKIEKEKKKKKTLGETLTN